MLLVAGCDKLFDITYVKGTDGTTDGGSDGDAAVPHPDAYVGPPCSAPAQLASFEALATGLDGITFPDDRSFAIAIAASRVFMAVPGEPFGQLATVSTIPGTTWAYPGVTPDGLTLYLANTTDTAVYESTRSSTSSDWSPPTMRTDIATTARPGGLASLPGGELRMVVNEGPAYREYAKSDTTWTKAQQTSSFAELTTLTSGTLGNPSLTSDGLILVFTVTGSSSDGVYFVKRPDTALATKFSLATATAWGQLTKISATTLATPYLANDCSFYVIADKILRHYH